MTPEGDLARRSSSGRPAHRLCPSTVLLPWMPAQGLFPKRRESPDDRRARERRPRRRRRVPRAFADAAAVMIHHSFDMVSIYDANANFAFASPSHERVLGYTPDELIGTSPVDLLHPEEREIVAQAFAEQLLVTGQPAPVEHRIRHRDGSWVWVESVAINLGDDPAVGGILVNAARRHRPASRRADRRGASGDPRARRARCGDRRCPRRHRRDGRALDPRQQRGDHRSSTTRTVCSTSHRRRASTPRCVARSTAFPRWGSTACTRTT